MKTEPKLENIKPEKTALKIEQPTPLHHRKLFGIKYPKFLILGLTFVIAYFIFQGRSFDGIESLLVYLGFFGTFITGILLSYGFTAAPAVAFILMIADHQNIYIATLIGAFGALCGDYLFFLFLRTSFNDEINQLKKEKFVKRVDGHIPIKMRHLLLIIFGDLFLASPLPDELGVALLSMEHHVTRKKFIATSFILHIIGIFVMLSIGVAT